MLHSTIAATTTMPSASANTGSEVCTRQPPHDSTNSPVWPATQAAPSEASAINSRNRMIRCIRTLLRRLGERRHGLGRELTGHRERRVARIGLVEPALRGGAIGRRQRLQLAPRFLVIVAQRRGGDARDHIAAVVADRVGALDANQFGGVGPQPVDQRSRWWISGAGGDSFGTSASSSRQSAAAPGTPEAAKPSSGFSASGFGASDFAAVSAAG